MELLQTQMGNNPAVQKTLEQIKAAGGDPKQALMKAMIENGMNQNGMMQVINQLQNICL